MWGAAGAAQLPGSCSWRTDVAELLHAKDSWGTRRWGAGRSGPRSGMSQTGGFASFHPSQSKNSATLTGPLFCREQVEERFASANPGVRAAPSSPGELPYPCTDLRPPILPRSRLASQSPPGAFLLLWFHERNGMGAGGSHAQGQLLLGAWKQMKPRESDSQGVPGTRQGAPGTPQGTAPGLARVFPGGGDSPQSGAL